MILDTWSFLGEANIATSSEHRDGLGVVMRQIVCPECESRKVHHYTDAYVIRTPTISKSGKLKLLAFCTNEYDDSFFECLDCGHRPSEAEILSAAFGTSASMGSSHFTDALGVLVSGQ